MKNRVIYDSIFIFCDNKWLEIKLFFIGTFIADK